MPGLVVPGMHEFLGNLEDVGGRDKPGHDEEYLCPRNCYEISTIWISAVPASTTSPTCLPMSA